MLSILLAVTRQASVPVCSTYLEIGHPGSPSTWLVIMSCFSTHIPVPEHTSHIPAPSFSPELQIERPLLYLEKSPSVHTRQPHKSALYYTVPGRYILHRSRSRNTVVSVLRNALRNAISPSPQFQSLPHYQSPFRLLFRSLRG